MKMNESLKVYCLGALDIKSVYTATYRVEGYTLIKEGCFCFLNDLSSTF